MVTTVLQKNVLNYDSNLIYYSLSMFIYSLSMFIYVEITLRKKNSLNLNKYLFEYCQLNIYLQ